ncbi:hypothetical protein EYC84_010273 [Monilinia fructicola]|uniref:Mid2 domain-containing protein n=1 Tax=Monilinia fructicola TaxID=38448 RepID=A0A5M9JHF5_MONFR|nr:hypothetical protein EYC84_010273 [Monilinia fructicola]
MEGVVKSQIFARNGGIVTWGNPSCPDYCLGSSSGNHSLVNVIACNAADSDGTWCCAYDGNCCSGSSTFVPGFGTMFAEPGSSLTTSAAASGSTSPSASTTPSISQAPLISATVSTSSPTATNTSRSSSSSSKTSTIVGAAVGIPLGLAAAAALFLLYRERRKRMGSNATGFGMKKLDDSGSAGFAGMAPPQESPTSMPYAPNAPGEPMKGYGELGARDPHYELGPGVRSFELGNR